MPSTAIRSTHYDADRQLLQVEFITGRRYVYYDVPPEEAEALRNASSKGRQFNARIRDRYEFAEVAAADG